MTAILPIVAIDLETDPVAAGYVTSLAHPGGNVTGVFLDQAELSGKWLELLREAVPGLSRVAVLREAATPLYQLNAIEAAVKKLAVNLRTLEIRRVQDIDGAFAQAVSSRAQAMEAYRGTIGRSGTCIRGGAVATGLGLDRDRAFYPVVTIVIASYYALFAVMGASTHALILESLVPCPRGIRLQVVTH